MNMLISPVSIAVHRKEEELRASFSEIFCFFGEGSPGAG
jgi:hypothetical protein